MAIRRPIRLPRQWPEHVKSGILHAISLASVVLTAPQGRAIGRRRLRAELEQAQTEIALFREELAIKDGRWTRSRSRRRPHYTSIQRLRILQLRAARGWGDAPQHRDRQEIIDGPVVAIPQVGGLHHRYVRAA